MDSGGMYPSAFDLTDCIPVERSKAASSHSMNGKIIFINRTPEEVEKSMRRRWRIQTNVSFSNIVFESITKSPLQGNKKIVDDS
jgi:hypothetical protein